MVQDPNIKETLEALAERTQRFIRSIAETKVADKIA
jgi:hypothetical protein